MSDEHLELLKRIAKDVADIKAAMGASVLATASALGVQAAASNGSAAGGVASDAEMNGQYGDPEIRKDPSRWSGEPFAGKRFSETTPDYLDCVASFKDWQAEKDEKADAKDAKGRPRATWSRRDARLARGWAARLRAGWKRAASGGGSAPATNEDYDAGDDSDIPFCLDATIYGRWDRP
jgi:hypothetical protein